MQYYLSEKYREIFNKVILEYELKGFLYEISFRIDEILKVECNDVYDTLKYYLYYKFFYFVNFLKFKDDGFILCDDKGFFEIDVLGKDLNILNTEIKFLIYILDKLRYRTYRSLNFIFVEYKYYIFKNDINSLKYLINVLFINKNWR